MLTSSTLTIFIKKIFKDSRRVKKNRNYVSKRNLYLYFLIELNLLKNGEKNADVSRTQEVCHRIHIFFGTFFR